MTQVKWLTRIDAVTEPFDGYQQRVAYRYWRDASLAEPVGPFAWRRWSARWDATPGEHVLACRATDAAGNQLTEPNLRPQSENGQNRSQSVTWRSRRGRPARR